MQKDAEFKIRKKQLGGHIHCRLFSKYRDQSTWAKCGDFVIREDENSAMMTAMHGIQFERDD